MALLASWGASPGTAGVEGGSRALAAALAGPSGDSGLGREGPVIIFSCFPSLNGHASPGSWRRQGCISQRLGRLLGLPEFTWTGTGAAILPVLSWAATLTTSHTPAAGATASKCFHLRGTMPINCQPRKPSHLKLPPHTPATSSALGVPWKPGGEAARLSPLRFCHPLAA